MARRATSAVDADTRKATIVTNPMTIWICKKYWPVFLTNPRAANQKVL